MKKTGAGTEGERIGLKIIVGLGNPGNEYARTRHNAGFDAVEILSEKEGIPIKKIKCHSLLGEGTVGGERTVLVRPQTFMNLSGQAVAEVMSWYKCPPEDVMVIHDDIDLPVGRVRIRPSGGAGTHNGMRNIIYLTGTEAFPRIRIGVGKQPEKWDLKDWVLSTYADEAERKAAYDALCLAADAADCFIRSGIALCMNRFNIRSRPERETGRKADGSNEGTDENKTGEDR